MNILLTSGGTRVPIDDVRSIVNFSTGNFGKRIATEALLAGHKVMQLHNINTPTPFEFKVDLMKPHQDYASMLDGLHSFSRLYFSKFQHRTFDTFDEYASQLELLLVNFQYDVVILCAAVSDYRVKDEVDGKISSDEDEVILHLERVEKLISKVKQIQPDTKLVGFKLLSGSERGGMLRAIEKSINFNHCDMVVGNDLTEVVKPRKEVYFGVKFPTQDKRYWNIESQKVTGTSKEIASKLITTIESLEHVSKIVSTLKEPPKSVRLLQSEAAAEVTRLFF